MFAGSPLLLLLLLLLVGSLVVCCGSSPELEVQTSAWLPTAGEVCVGWQPPPSDHAAQLFTPSCTIPRISATEWRHRLALGHLDSVVIEGAVDNSEFQAMTRRDELLRRYGSTSVILSSANTFSYAKREQRFSEYLESLRPRDINDVAGETFYFFGGNDFTEWSNFTDHYVRPEFTYVREPSYSFGIGSSGSGVPFHTHGAVFAEVLHGHKRWFLARPGKKPAFSPDQTSLYWVTEILPTLNNTADILDCTLGPGEVLWIDSQWWHATLNIGDTVFMSTFI